MSRPKRYQSLRGVKLFTQYENTPELESKIASQFAELDAIMNEHSETDARTMIVNMASESNDGCATVAGGCIYGVITSMDRETYQKYSTLLQQTNNPQITLTPVNFLAIEMFWALSDPVRDNLLVLISDMLRWKLHKIEIIISNIFKSFLDFGSLAPRFPVLISLLRMIKPYSDFIFSESREGHLVIVTAATVCVHYLVEVRQCPMDKSADAKRVIVGQLEVLLSQYSGNMQNLLGRQVLFIVNTLSKHQEIVNVWKKMVTAPTTLAPNCMGVFELLKKPPAPWVDVFVLPTQLTRKLEYLVGYPQPQLYRRSLANFHQQLQQWSPEGHLRSLCIRYILNPNMDAAQEAKTHDNRIMLIDYFLSNCRNQMDQPNYLELALCKMTIFYEWFSFEGTGPIPTSIVLSWKYLSHAVLNNPQVANSLFDFLISFVNKLYPPITEVLIRNVSRGILALQKLNYPVGNILDCGKLEKPIREQFRETFPELAHFFRRLPSAPEPQLAPPPPLTSSVSQISIADVLLEPEEPVKKEEKPVPVKVKRKVKKAKPVETVTVDPVNPAGWDASLGETVEAHSNCLSDDLKDLVAKLESSVFESKDNVEDMLNIVLANIESNAETIDEDDEQADAIADCFLVIFKKFLTEKKFMSDPKPSGYDVTDDLQKPFYKLFKQLYTSSETSVFYHILSSMHVKCPQIGYLLLFYLVSSKIQTKLACHMPEDNYADVYVEFCNVLEKDVTMQLAEDTDSCAFDDLNLYRHLIPLVLAVFCQYTVGSEHLIKTICCHCDSETILDLVNNCNQENFEIFRRETFASIATRSLEWEGYQQIFFWHLVKAEGLNMDWMVAIMPKLDYEKHPEASFQMIVLLRTFGEPTMAVVKQLLARPGGDLFAFNAIKVLIQEDSDCQKFAQNVNVIMKKALGDGDILEYKKTGRGAASKKPVSIQNILSHLDVLRRYCLAKPSNNAERFLVEFAECFNEMKNNASCADLTRDYAELFSAVEIISGKGTGTRNTRRRNKNNDKDPSPSQEKETRPSRKRPRKIEDVDFEDL